MRSCWVLSTAAVVLALGVGCDQKGRFAIPIGTKAVPTIKPAPTGAPSAMSASNGTPIRAEDATGVWNQSQVEQYLMEDLKLVSVSIQSEGGANYRGTAVAQDGKNLTLAVRQVPGGIDVQWTDDRGGSGGMSFGNAIK